MGLIFSFSNDSGVKSTKKSDSLIIRVTHIFVKQISDQKMKNIIKKAIVPVRKSAHFIIYFVLGFLIISFLNEFFLVTYKYILITIFICFLYACSDEIHQLFILGRSAQVLDVVLDTIGSTFGCLVYRLLYLWRKKYEQKKAIS